MAFLQQSKVCGSARRPCDCGVHEQAECVRVIDHARRPQQLAVAIARDDQVFMQTQPAGILGHTGQAFARDKVLVSRGTAGRLEVGRCAAGVDQLGQTQRC